MADLFLDFKDFEHVKSDKDSTTLRHKKKGHMMTLAHNVLSPKHKEVLKALAGMGGKQEETDSQKSESEDQKSSYGKVIQRAEGGYIPRKAKPQGPREYGDPNPAPQTKEQSDREVLKDYGSSAGGAEKKGWWAEGGEVDCPKPMADGGDPALEPDYIDSALQAVPQPAGGIMQVGKELIQGGDKMPETAGQGVGQAIGRAIEKGILAPTEKGKEALQGIMHQGNQVVQGIQKGVKQLPQDDPPQAMEQSNAPQGVVPEQFNAQQAQNGQSNAPSLAPQAQDPMVQSQNGVMQGYQNQLAGIQQQAQATGELGKEQAAIHDRQIQAQQVARSAYQDQYNMLEKERQDHMADIKNGYIDPNKYWTGGPNGEGGHSKVAAGVGMILAGFNPTNSPNAAINYLKYQMDQNLEAQKQNLGAKQSLLSANLRQFGNLREATEMTRIMQNDIMSNELLSAAGKAQTPMAKAAALQAAGQLQREAAMQSQQFAFMRSMSQMGQDGSGGNEAALDHMINVARVIKPEMAKEMEQRRVPGFGVLAKVPVTPELRNKITGHIQFDKEVADLQDFVKNNTTFVPGTAAYAKGMQKALALQAAIREGKLGTVYREGEQPLLDKFVSQNPAGLSKFIKTPSQLDELRAMNQRDFGPTLQQVGLPMPKRAVDQTHPNEGKTAVNKQGQKIMMKNGQWVPVK